MNQLEKTSLDAALSDLGKTIETPKGIFYWGSRAKKEAEIDGTVGIAQEDDGTLFHLASAEKWAGESVLQRVQKGRVFGYAPIEGLQSLREKWLAKILEKHPQLAGNATLPIVANGITHSLALAGRLLLNKGDTLITASKSWENYEHIFTDVQGVKIATFEIFKDGKFNVGGMIALCEKTAKEERLPAGRQGKVVLLLNFPHNQTGYMPSAEEAKEIGEKLQALCIKFPKIPFVVLLDDAYEGYVFNESGQKFSILSQVFASISNLTVVKMDGISKVMLAYGYRVGFITFFVNSLNGAAFNKEEMAGISAEIGSKVGGFIRGEISQVNHHGQVLADALMDNWEMVTRERNLAISVLAERFKLMMEALEEGYKKYGRQKLWADPCNGGFFAFINLANGIDPKAVAEKLLSDKKVGVVPGTGGMRVAFCGVPAEKIKKMVEAIFEVVYS